MTGVVLATVLVSALCILELRSSWLESHVLSAVARRATFVVKPGPSLALARSASGPYDRRLGLSQLPEFVHRLEARGYQVDSQAWNSPVSLALTHLGLFPIYREKDQAGLVILDHDGNKLYGGLYPRQAYPDFDSIPPLVVDTLLFIENREMLDSSRPFVNPAVQWGRLSRAVVDLAAHKVYPKYRLIGGSTLATQLEKMRHSRGGRTDSVGEKARQMLSASLAAYQNGPETLQAQQDIVCDYINSIPLAATPGQGEVIGLADGLRAWYGANFAVVNGLLSTDERLLDRKHLAARARAYREVLSLLLALREPSQDLVVDPDALAQKTDRYLRVLSDKGIISPRLRNLALRTRLQLKPDAAPTPPQSFIANKAPNAIRMALLPMLGLDDTYALNHLDLTARTTLDKGTQNSVTGFLESLSHPDSARAAGLDQYQQLNVGDPKTVIYSVTLYERGLYEHGQGANLLRIQADNYNHPLDINQGTKLQLGSTAKLRTLINYLQIIEDLHSQYAALPAEKLKAAPVFPGDNLTQWALDYLSKTTDRLSKTADRGLEPMLEAALQRKYSGNPGEAFFTAGGLHRFENFDASEDGQFFTVSAGFQRSVNLVYIRLMRDIEHYYMFRVPGVSPAILTDPDGQERRQYLDRFADSEGRTFLRRFYEKYKSETPDRALQTLVAGVPLTAVRAAVIFRSVRPQASLEEFSAFLRAHLPASALAATDMSELYGKYGPDKFDLNDRGYLAHVHPLELWLLNYRELHPNATLSEIVAKSRAQRQEVYAWLFKTRFKHAQDERIGTLLERDAFKEIHRAWKSVGYPFDSLVPSYATCIGVSGDTPQALAELAGILLNDGVSYPSMAIRQLEFAENTPYGVVLTRQPGPGVRVLSPVIAKLVRQDMIGVVENGTGRLAHGGLKLADGTVLPIGGKTGTGDNRFQEFSARGSLLGSHVVNRTAAFVFFIGDRFYGTILAFVPGKAAANYEFTSALAVQVLKDLEPRLEPLILARKKQAEAAGGSKFEKIRQLTPRSGPAAASPRS